MEEFGAWVIENKKWLFSGAGVVIIAWLGRFVFNDAVISISGSDPSKFLFLFSMGTSR